jgi:DNA-binding MarR family transcriptional regulator
VPTSSIASDTERLERLEFVASNLLSRAALLVRLLVRQVGEAQVSRTEGEVLVVLSDGPRRITELAELEGLAQPTMTLLIKRLESNGWVAREGLPEDGRVVMVNITRRGRAVLEAFRAHFLTALRSDLEELSDKRLEELSDATETLASFVDELQAGFAR